MLSESPSVHSTFLKFLQSPIGKNYFIPSSPVRKKHRISIRKISIENKSNRNKIFKPSKDLFHYHDKTKESFYQTKSLKLHPIKKEKSQRSIRKINYSKDDLPYSRQSPQSSKILLSSKVFLPKVKYTLDP